MKFKFSDEVSLRMVQIFQEALLLGMDGADLFREVRLTQSDSDPDSLVLDPEYVALVKKNHEDLLAHADVLSSLEAKRSSSIVGSD
jgi:hypothetical protein